MMARRPTREELAAETALLDEMLGRAARDEAYWGAGPVPPESRYNGLLGLLLNRRAPRP